MRLSVTGGVVVTLVMCAAASAAAASAAAAPAFAVTTPVATAIGSRTTIDDFEDISAWSAHPADGVKLKLSSDAGAHGKALRLDFDFGGGGGYAVAHRAVSFDVPQNYKFRFTVKGTCTPNDLEFKLIDASGDDVWWYNRRRLAFPAHWDTLATKQRQISFAWGPNPGELRHVAAIEFAVTAGTGGKGTVWLDDLSIETLRPAGGTPPEPRASASSSAPAHRPALAADGAVATWWRSAPGDPRPALTLDLGEGREFGGLVIDWGPNLSASNYGVEGSTDARRWTELRTVRNGNGGRDWLWLPESEARFLSVRTLEAPAARGIGIAELALQPLEFGATLENFYAAIAKHAPRGSYPRGLSGEQSYWAVVGLMGDRDEGLLGEDGAFETGKAQFSIEPFLRVGGRLRTWADVTSRQSLEDGDLPIPIVTWRVDSLELETTAFGLNEGSHIDGEAAFALSYRVRNLSDVPVRATLNLAMRPFQVNPPTQFLNTPGGVATIMSLERNGSMVRVNGNRVLTSLTPPTAFGAATFDQGDIVEFMRENRLPKSQRVDDPFGHASGALAYDLELPAHGDRTILLRIAAIRPMGGSRATRDSSLRSVEPVLGDASYWHTALHLPHIELPPAGAEVLRTLNAQIGWIQVNRDGPAIQPGSRSYERSWIRDGALTSSALLRTGDPKTVREFVEWFAAHQYPNGKVPCCVDARGADPVPEHDSSGELIFAIADYVRYTGDRAFAVKMWPVVARAATYLDSLRHERLTREWSTPANREFHGLLPPSISHEGYSAKPMHSYWDDLFALRGFKDAAWLAQYTGREPERRRWSNVRDEFQRDLRASIGAAMAKHHIDYIPGCADLGDFDATSTTIALDPVDAAAALPPGALQRTFEKYWEFFETRRKTDTWDAFTPYEVRTIGAFVELGWRDRANAALDWFMKYRRPAGWAQWAEVVDHDPRHPRFIGDMPHTWVGSDFVRSVLTMFAYEREADSALVIGAGVPLEWVNTSPGVTVRDLPTPHGLLSYSMHASGDSVVVRIGKGVRVPRGGIVVKAPSAKAFRRAVLGVVTVPVGSQGAVTVRRVPAVLILK